MTENRKFGGRLRMLRRREGLSQAKVAERLGISASYLNLIENNKRPLPAALLIQVAQLFAVDLGFFAAEGEADLSRDLHEVLSDPLFDAMDISSAELKEMVAQSPSIARALLALYGAYRDAQHSATTLAVQVSEGEAQEGTEPTPQSPSEEVNDFIQASGNYFPDLEEAAERLWQRAALSENSIQDKLILALHEHHGVKVEIVPWSRLPGALRRYDPKKRQLLLSELLPTRSRRFQLAHQWCLLEHGELLDHHAEDPRFFSAASRSLARVSLANYFAGAVLMPYGPFLDAAKRERYDVDVLGRRYRVGFEQVCHRLTTLRRPKAEGIPFHMLRIDVAGNISKRFSGSGIRFARFGGACPRWNVFQAFMTPGMIRVQVGQMPDGRTFFCIARTIQRDSGGYHAPQPVMAVGLGCGIEHAKELVYSDGVDLEATPNPMGVSCRVCERTDCEQRAFPSLRQPLQIDENVRGASIYLTPRK